MFVGENGTVSLGYKKGGFSYKKGGHADEAEDRKLFKKMFKKEEKEEKAEKRAHGGAVSGRTDTARGLAGPKFHQQGVGYRDRGGPVPTETAGGGSGLGRLERGKLAAKVPAKTEI